MPSWSTPHPTELRSATFSHKGRRGEPAVPEVIAAMATPTISRFEQMREISDIGGLYHRTLAEARPVAIKQAGRLGCYRSWRSVFKPPVCAYQKHGRQGPMSLPPRRS
jgi:hypothetical protein